jgi:dolichyl-phosphate beta-glucosyltransferase
VSHAPAAVEPSSASINLSLIIPAYMEAASIAESLQDLAMYLKDHDFGVVEVVVVVADSPDGTAQIARSQASLFEHFKVHDVGPRVGKGRDVRAGILEAQGRYRIFMDADLATPLGHLEAAYAALVGGAGVVVAVRNLWSIHEGFLRKVMSKFGNFFIQILILPGIKDTQCGFKGFEAEAAKAIFARQTMMGWSFDAEILKIARLLKYRIATIEVADWKDPKADNMGLVGDSPLHAAVQTLMDTIKIRLNVWTGRYRDS